MDTKGFNLLLLQIALKTILHSGLVKNNSSENVSARLNHVVYD